MEAEKARRRFDENPHTHTHTCMKTNGQLPGSLTLYAWECSANAADICIRIPVKRE